MAAAGRGAAGRDVPDLHVKPRPLNLEKGWIHSVVSLEAGRLTLVAMHAE